MCTLSLADDSNCNFFYMQKASFCETFQYAQKSKNQSCLRTYFFFKAQKLRTLLSKKKEDFVLLEKANHSIATKLFANLLNNCRRN